MAKKLKLPDEEVIRVYEETNSIAETAIKCRVNYSTIYNRLDRLGVLKQQKRPEKPAIKISSFILADRSPGGASIDGSNIDSLLKLKEGAKIRVSADEGRVVTRTIDKVFKHHVLTTHPKGYKECFTKGEVLMYNYKRKVAEG